MTPDADRLTHSAEDRRAVEAQLGRPLRGRWAVARRCHLGIPMVIENHPRLESGEPFPTLFWLTCPILVKRSSRLEAGGHMDAVNSRIGRDGGARARLAGAIGRLRTRRDALEPITDSGAPPGGGPQRVKCLHAHVAHELADPPNPVGAEVLARAGFPDCTAACVSSRP
ncbi:MAG: DUF501 domain-containing protein [Actinomycetota bacterium]